MAKVKKMGKLSWRIVDFFIRNKWVFFLVLAGGISILVSGIQKIELSSDIQDTLPDKGSFKKFAEFIDRSNVSKQVVFSLGKSDSSKADIEELTLELEKFTQKLTNATDSLLTDITWRREDVEIEFLDYFHSSLPYQIDSNYYRFIERKLQDDSIKMAMENTHAKLTGPGSALFRQYLLKDPLSLSGKFLGEFSTSSSRQYDVEDGIVFSNSTGRAVVLATLGFNADHGKSNVILYQKVDSFLTEWNSSSSYSADCFGTFQITAENALQVSKDTTTTMIITLIAVLIILFGTYRRFSIPFFFVLPVGFGALFALGLIGFIRPNISSISLGTGAILFGIILDYSFHFFTHLNHSGSIRDSIEEITTPLLIGSFTTVTAFVALLFANSVVLQDFGIFASLSLCGAALFTLFALPVILDTFQFKPRKKKDAKIWNLRLPFKGYKAVLVFIGIIGLTIAFYFVAYDVEFDSDLNALSYHRQELKDKEKELVGINPEKERKMYLFATGSTREEALRSNKVLYDSLIYHKKDLSIVDVTSSAPFLPSDSLWELKKKRWSNFWDSRRERIETQILKIGDSLGFGPSAFHSFFSWTRTPDQPDSTLYHSLNLDRFESLRNGEYAFMTTVVLNKESAVEMEALTSRLKNVRYFDRSQAAYSMLNLVSQDFNFLLIVSSLIVLITLLIIYGRIELALLAFLPMVISWIWIIGLASLIGIKFNFVNVLLTTLLFGLGDDFSIFVTDGLLTKYRYGKNTLASYKNAILLSAITTIIGTGVLIFAKHPAIHSIAIVSVLGLFIILMVSLFIQPLLFEVFVQNRVDKKKAPITVLPFILSVFEFSYFTFGSIFLSGIWFIAVLIPLPKKVKRRGVTWLLRIFTGSVIYSSFHVPKKLYLKHLNFDKPSIIIANHTSFLDILFTVMLSSRIVLMVKKWVYKSPLFGPIIRYAGYIYTEHGAEKNLEDSKKIMDEGYSILVFPEGSRSKTDQMKRFHKGAFLLAEKLEADITPLLIHGAHYTLPKGEYYVKNAGLHMKALPRIRFDDNSWGENYRERAKSISKYFKEEYQKFKKEQEQNQFIWSRVFKNYLYKGPVIEWYVLVKWKLEYANFRYYDEIIGNKKKIINVGCGYGYLDLYLHYRNEERLILGMDYDEDKIQIAQNTFDKTDNVRFIQEDIREYDFPLCDVIMFHDVLHYMSLEKQHEVLTNAFQSIMPGGMILIRDGITDLMKVHRNTVLTEFLSTKVFKFNRQTEKLCFPSKDFIEEIAEKNSFEVEMIKHSTKTSNVLFILRKLSEDVV